MISHPSPSKLNPTKKNGPINIPLNPSSTPLTLPQLKNK